MSCKTILHVIVGRSLHELKADDEGPSHKFHWFHSPELGVYYSAHLGSCQKTRPCLLLSRALRATSEPLTTEAPRWVLVLRAPLYSGALAYDIDDTVASVF